MKNTEGSSAATRMDLDLEISILSEIRQRHIHQISCTWNLKKKKKKDTGCSGPVHWDDPEGWDGVGGGRGIQEGGTHVHPWLIHVNVWQKTITIL